MNESNQTNPQTSNDISSQEKKLLQLHKKKEADLNRILGANEEFLKQSSQSHMEKMHQLAPPLARSNLVEQEYPCLDFVTIGEYVEVEEDTSPNMNRPHGMGYVTNVHAIEDCQSVADVKYTQAFDNGRTHRSIPIDHLTIVNMEQQLTGRRRSREQSNPLTTDECVNVAPANKPKIVYLLDLLHAC